MKNLMVDISEVKTEYFVPTRYVTTTTDALLEDEAECATIT